MAEFHRIQIKDIYKETDDTSVLTFDIPEELRVGFNFRQGQHLTLRHMIKGEDLRRSYSLCSSPIEGKWQVAVKKIPEGKFSTYVNEQLATGDYIDLMPPSGTFGVDVTNGMSRIINQSNTSIQKLTQIVHLHVNLAVQNPNGMSALNSDWMHLEKKRGAYIQMRDDYESNFRLIIKQGITAGELKDMDVNVVVFSMLTTLRSLYLWIPKKNIEELQSFSEDLAEAVSYTHLTLPTTSRV